MYQDSFPILPGFYAIREMLTDEECRMFMESMFYYRRGDAISSDYYISKINRDMRNAIWKYREAVDAFLTENNLWEA